MQNGDVADLWLVWFDTTLICAKLIAGRYKEMLESRMGLDSVLHFLISCQMMKGMQTMHKSAKKQPGKGPMACPPIFFGYIVYLGTKYQQMPTN
jgi:hypothetical protein